MLEQKQVIPSYPISPGKSWSHAHPFPKMLELCICQVRLGRMGFPQ